MQPDDTSIFVLNILKLHFKSKNLIQPQNLQTSIFFNYFPSINTSFIKFSHKDSSKRNINIPPQYQKLFYHNKLNTLDLMLQAENFSQKRATFIFFPPANSRFNVPTSNEIIFVELLILYVAHILNNPWIEVNVYIFLYLTIHHAAKARKAHSKFNLKSARKKRGKFLFFRSMWWKNFIFPVICFPSNHRLLFFMTRADRFWLNLRWLINLMIEGETLERRILYFIEIIELNVKKLALEK